MPSMAELDELSVIHRMNIIGAHPLESVAEEIELL